MDKQVEGNTRVIHVFDRKGDIAEVFDRVRELKHTGVLVRATYNRSLDLTGERLWQKMESEPNWLRGCFAPAFTREIEVPAAAGRKARSCDTGSTFPSD
ncbi:hypothetical protein [Pannus brasiliensis]|uniref:hypothetical protein n=1 Tax=Pannus brasiliensis TaxID=1579216 RepID=UPI002FCDA4C4